ncbi:MAG TPA: hypothetical protein VFS43_23970 [Polyangiaceae bacterium]|nr:hypothetical protein [Polyangiaceae bacterium]
MPFQFKPTYTLAEWAEVLGVTPAVARRRLREAGFPPAKSKGTKQVFTLAELKARCPKTVESIAMAEDFKEKMGAAKEMMDVAAEALAPVLEVADFGRGKGSVGTWRGDKASGLEALQRAIAREQVSITRAFGLGVAPERTEDEAADELAEKFGANREAVLAAIRQVTGPAREAAERLGLIARSDSG